MIIAIMGKSASGKDTCIRKILQNVKGTSKILYCTTRPIRTNEQCGTDYRFMSDEEFEIFKQKGLFVSYYETKNSLDDTIWKYGYLKQDLLQNGINLMVVNPNDYHQLKKYIDKCVYLHCDLLMRIRRSLQRVEFTPRNLEEILRRAEADSEDFVDIIYDIIIDNTTKEGYYKLEKYIQNYK